MDISAYKDIHKWCTDRGVTLIAVSKTHPPEAIMALYEAGQRDFGENKVQELLPKYNTLPKDIRWHLIGHLQSNKVADIAPFIHLVHSIDSLKLLQELNKQALRQNRMIDYLLQIHIASEETKYGLSEAELWDLLNNPAFASLKNVRLRGLMGMATNTPDKNQVAGEFEVLKKLFDTLQLKAPDGAIDVLSMGMSQDYTEAIASGSTYVRIGSLLFGKRSYL